MKVSAIICAAGRGERAAMGKNKLLADLDGAPALWHTLNAFCLPCIDEVIVACSPADMPQISALCAPFGYIIAEGGGTRTESVYNALGKCTGDIVLIHDGARPYVTEQTIYGCIACVQSSRSGVCAVPVTDTIAVAEGGRIAEVPDRSRLFAVQTPQGFWTKDIKAAYELAAQGGETYTDDSAVFRRYIAEPTLCEGSRDNIKLTYKSDFTRAYPAISAANGCAVGLGADVHAFGGDNKFVTLCGVKIDCDRGLVAHSDGDVPVHALMDALLSAAGLKDIGHYFPDDDPQYDGADSMKLLERVVRLVRSRGLRPAGASIAIRAEQPRLSAHIGRMQENICRALDLPTERAGISAGTNEKLGFVGNKLGIEALAAVILEETYGEE